MKFARSGSFRKSFEKQNESGLRTFSTVGLIILQDNWRWSHKHDLECGFNIRGCAVAKWSEPLLLRAKRNENPQDPRF